MRRSPLFIQPIFSVGFAFSLVLLLAMSSGRAQDPFSFMPLSGPELLTQVLSECGDCTDIATLAGEEGTPEEWLERFTKIGALDGLTEDQVTMLVNYLAINFPNGATDTSSLPRGGRSMTILNCQLCHSIAVPMTQERTLDRWSQHRYMAPHDTLSLTDKEWETLAHYLTVSAPLPLEAIPEQLRRGAGGY